ncbi:MAG: polysaccharide biosynthesis tyrosine autokinase, partial [Bacteroidales bacterium]
MSESQNFNLQEENDLKKIIEMILRNYKLFITWIILAIGLAYLVNRFSIPVYKISSSVLIKEDKDQTGGSDANNYLNSSLFRMNQNFQNELWVLKSSTVIEQTIKNLDLEVSYYLKKGFKYLDAYKNAPFHIVFEQNHVQPINVRFYITFMNKDYFEIRAESGKTSFYNFENNEITFKKDRWSFLKNGKIGELIETSDLAFTVELDSAKRVFDKEKFRYGFEFNDIPSLVTGFKNEFIFINTDKLSTVVEISLKNESLIKGIDLVNELMHVSSIQNLDRKNHLATITIDYIEKQLNEISDSLNQTENNLQRFRSSNQLLNINEQANNISTQYTDLQNQLAALAARKKYYDYVSGYLSKNDNFSNIIVPASIGIPDPLLNNLMSELIDIQAQRANLINSDQEKNPLVQKLGIQIENIKKTISENISAAGRTTGISIDEMNKRIKKTENEISRLPATQRQLGNIERKYRLNDAIYNYMLEKRAEAKITKASNLPDDIIIEPAKMVGFGPVSPNKKLNYLIALILGMAVPFGYLMIRSALNNKVETQDDIQRLTDVPVLGKILHNKYKTANVMFEFPKSNIAESYRALRTNLDFYVRGGQKKVIMVTSSMEGEGKSFIALNIAMSYAQLGRRTILLDFDMRKRKIFFDDKEEPKEGLSSYLINNADLEDIIIKSPHEKLDYILSGVIPPNPTELMALDKTEKLITQLKNNYDYIVMDTTPLAQVTDAYLLINHAEVKVMLARYNYTIKTVFSLIMKDLKQKNIDHVCIVMNDNRYNRDQYGYGYGYNNKVE